MIPSIMTILQDKKNQLSAVLLVKSAVHQVHCFPFLAASETRRKLWWINPALWRIGEFGDPANEAMVRRYVEIWVGVARDKSTPCMIASSVPIVVPGVKVELFGNGWGAWEQIGRECYEKQDKNRPVILEGDSLRWITAWDKDNDLAKAFFGAWYLAQRWNFFPATPEDVQEKMLAKAGARAVGVNGDIRAISLKQWRQPVIPGPPSSASPLAGPKTKKGNILG